MRTSRLYQRVLGVAMVIAAALSTSCFLTLDWDPNNQPCTNNTCLPGYSCLGQRCVEDSSIALGRSCTRDVQCVTGGKCFENICRKPCVAYYGATSECPEAFYCKPHRDTSTTAFAFVGGCVPSECTADTDCDCPELCTPITSTANACLTGCAIAYTGASVRDDPTCHSTCASAQCTRPTLVNYYCQPVGSPIIGQRLAYLETPSSTVAVGASCSPVENPCGHGAACTNDQAALENSCIAYCNPNASNSGCGAGRLCCAHTVDGVHDYALCETTSLCPAPSTR